MNNKADNNSISVSMDNNKMEIMLKWKKILNTIKN